MKTIEQLIDEALVRKPHVKSGKWSPSMFGRCFRAQFWNRKNEEPSNPPDERTLRVFKAGFLFEDFVTGLIVKGNNFRTQVDVESEDVKGRADIVGHNEVTDVKSQHSRSFWWMLKSPDVKKDRYSNWLQVLYYTRELNKEFGRLVFISKDDLCIQEYVQPLDDFWLKQLEVELMVLRNMWRAQNLPPASPRCFIDKKTGKSKECKYCNWIDKCKEIEKGVKK